MKKEDEEFYEKIINGKDISDNITKKEGIVLEKEIVDNSEYVTSGKSYYNDTTDSFSNHSTTRKNKNIIEKIYVQFNDNKEAKISLNNKDSDIRTGSELSFFYINNKLEYIKNKNTDRIIHMENVIFDYVKYENMALKINAFLMGILCAIPFLGTLVAFSFLFSYAPTVNFKKAPLKNENIIANSIIFVLSLWYTTNIYNDFNNLTLENVITLYIVLLIVIAFIRYMTDLNIINKAKDFEKKVRQKINL